jgi:hypothetical protein
VRIGPKAESVSVSNTEFINIGHSAVEIAPGAHNVSITNNTFNDSCVLGDGSCDSILVGEGASRFILNHNVFFSEGTNKPRSNINLAGANDAYQVIGNQLLSLSPNGVLGGTPGPGRILEWNH